ncbi:MAG: hypothetical protein EZS28_048363 [Streblomastix strix]|uniref:Uncharacterized protein n=1 Tax=Streblomastix strix TaxID=222440 RepID=A0A5J4TEN4_9EUKA|nr:MAG: hypothetical protein EZS28_048363 [Streblomastix strix]
MGSIQSVKGKLSKAEADAGIQGYKGQSRQLRHYGGYDPNDLVKSNREAQQLVNQILIPQSQQLTQQADADTSRNINDCFNEPSHDTSSKIERYSFIDANNDLQYIEGGLNWGQKPVYPWYGKFPNEPHKVVDFKVTDQGALTARQRKILLSKEDRLNLDKPKTRKIATKRIISAIKAQSQLKNKLGRKKK